MGKINTDIILEGSNLNLSFGGVKSLDNVSFKINRGDIFSIIGPNGAGKTCLLNCISGYYRPQKGTIIFENQNLLTLPAYQIARRGISRTFQNPSLYSQMTVLENLLLARYIFTRSNIVEAAVFFGRSRQEEITSRRVIAEIMAFVQIEDLQDMPISIMSYGQRKQVEIARALVIQPRLILFDEPTSGLDDAMKSTVAELILKIQKRGTTIVLVEHDMEVIMGLSQSVIVLDFGQKIGEGTPEQVSQDSRVIEAYLGGNGYHPQTVPSLIEEKIIHK